MSTCDPNRGCPPSVPNVHCAYPKCAHGEAKNPAPVSATEPEEKKGWIGVDLDGTIAMYDGWKGEKHVGAPIMPMVERVKAWRAAGIPVRIFTARVSTRDADEMKTVTAAIEQWCVEHLGEVLPVTCSKDYQMIALWDDRATQVVANTGVAVEDIVATLRARLVEAERVTEDSAIIDALAAREIEVECMGTTVPYWNVVVVKTGEMFTASPSLVQPTTLREALTDALTAARGGG